MSPQISLTRRAALAAALCLALAGGVGAGIVGLIFGPQIFNQIDENRTAIRVSCGLLNRAIEQSQAAAAAPDSPTALLIAEIVEGMDPQEQRAYTRASQDAVPAGAQRNPCGRVADKAYD